MFIEQNITGERRGWIEVVCGSMFSGKTEELIRRLKRAKIANLQVAIYKPATDTRFDVNKVVSHDANFIESIPVKNASEILALSKTNCPCSNGATLSALLWMTNKFRK